MKGRDDPQALLQQVALHESRGQLGEAMATYQRLLKQWPDLPNSWYNLGLLQRRSGRFEDALVSYQQALDRGIEQPEEVHLNRGAIYADALRRDREAEAELRAALALNPVYGPALLNLANLHEDRGERDAAMGLYERLLALDPGCHEGLARYASLRGVHSATDPLAARLCLHIDHPATPLPDKASLAFALGKVLDGCAAYDEAFAAYTRANQFSAASLRTTGPLYDPKAHEHSIDALIRVFNAPRREAVAASEPAPIFICGMFRSGSTLAEQVLAAHPAIVAGGEISCLPQLAQGPLAPYPDSLLLATPAQLAAFAAQYRQALARLAPAGQRVTDKRPDNYLHIGLIKTLFPNARIVHTTRSPLDNALSVYFLHLDQRMGYALDLAHIGHHYRQYRRLMEHWHSLYGEDILEFNYDAFVQSPRAAVEELLAFCGLPWDEACLAFHAVRNTVRTASVWQVRQPLYQQSSGRWRHYERHLGPLRSALGGLLGDDAATAG